MLFTLSFSLIYFASAAVLSYRMKKIRSRNIRNKVRTQSRYVLQQWHALIYTISVAYEYRLYETVAIINCSA